MIFALLISGAVCFAYNGEDKKETKKTENKENQIAITNESEENEEDLACTASCWAEIRYNGEYVTTLYESATASDCTTAQTICLSSVNIKARNFIKAQE